MANSADPDQLAFSEASWLFQKPTDLDLHCLQNRIYLGSAGQLLTVQIVQVWGPNGQMFCNKQHCIQFDLLWGMINITYCMVVLLELIVKPGPAEPGYALSLQTV